MGIISAVRARFPPLGRCHAFKVTLTILAAPDRLKQLFDHLFVSPNFKLRRFDAYRSIVTRGILPIRFDNEIRTVRHDDEIYMAEKETDGALIQSYILRHTSYAVARFMNL